MEIHICNKCNQYVLHLINYPRLHDTIKFTDDKIEEDKKKNVNDFISQGEWEAVDQINLSVDKNWNCFLCHSSGKLGAFMRFKTFGAI